MAGVARVSGLRPTAAIPGAGAQRSRSAGVRRMLLHQRGPSGAEFGDDATVGTGPIAWD